MKSPTEFRRGLFNSQDFLPNETLLKREEVLIALQRKNYSPTGKNDSRRGIIVLSPLYSERGRGLLCFFPLFAEQLDCGRQNYGAVTFATTFEAYEALIA